MLSWRISLLAVALCGCDRVLGLEVTPPDAALVEPDAPADAEVVVDAPPGAEPACWTSGAYQSVGVIPAAKYRVSAEARTWLDAKAACDDDGPGAHLAVITHPEAELSALAASSLTSDLVWVGLDDRVTEGTWVAQTLEPVPRPPTPLWRSGEPNNSLTSGEPEGEDCATLADGGLNDRGCGTMVRALCECELPVTCNDAAGALTLLRGPYAGLEAARTACADTQRKLVEISTPDELEAVRQVVAQAAVAYAWIDLAEPAPRDWLASSGCRPYLRWAHVAGFEPEPNGGTQEDCGAMSSEGAVDLQCTASIPAVCEEP